MHPWHGIVFTERKQKHAEMRRWIAENPEQRLRHGQTREDGKRFCGYSVGYANGEYWADTKVFETRLEAARRNMREWRKDENYKKAHTAYCRSRYANQQDVREKTKKRQRAWSEKHPERINQRASNRRALKRSLHHPQHDESVELRLHEEAKRLTAETGIEHHIDHIIPIKHGGFHHHDNLQVLPANVNLAKSSTPFWISSTYKDFRSVPQSLWPEPLIDFYLAMRTV